MELRMLTTEAERRMFLERMTRARALANGGFSETPRSKVGEIHLQFASMLALFDDAGPDPEKMLAGCTMHSLATFPQSHPQPDFSYYAPEDVYEVGEMWSLTKHGGTLTLRGLIIMLGLLQAKCGLGYAIVKPWDLSIFYRELLPKGEAVEWPYARTLDGGKIHCRAMVSEGDHLRAFIERVWATGFETYDRHRRIRFPEYVGELPERLPGREELIVAPGLSNGEETNGAAHM